MLSKTKIMTLSSYIFILKIKEKINTKRHLASRYLNNTSKNYVDFK